MNELTAEYGQSIFNLSEPKQGYLSEANKNFIKELSKVVKKRKKLILVSGEQGCGKSTLVKRAVHDLGDKTLLSFIDVEDIEFNHLFGVMCGQFNLNISKDFSEQQKLDELKHYIKSHSPSRLLLVTNLEVKIDGNILESLFQFLDCSSLKSQVVLLVASEYKQDLETLLSTTKYANDYSEFQIGNLNHVEVKAYINHHLEGISFKKEPIFTDEALERIAKYSKGLPKLINRLCNLGLLTANIDEKSTVTEDMIDEVLENSLFLGNEFDYQPTENNQPESFINEHFLGQTISSENKSDDGEVSDSSNDSGLESIFGKSDRIYNTSYIKSFEPTKSGKPTKKLHPKLEKKAVHKDAQKHQGKVLTINVSFKTLLVSIFILGVLITSAIIASGYFLYNKGEIDRFFEISGSPTSEPKKNNENLVQTEPNKHAVEQALENQLQKAFKNNSPDNLLQKEIAELLSTAERQLANKKLMTPANDNAWDTYTKILSKDPNNEEAIFGLNKIKSTYVRWAKSEQKKDNEQRAMYFYQKALEISPDDSELLQQIALLKQSSQQKLSSPDSAQEVLGAEYRKWLEEPDGIAKLLALAETQLKNKKLTEPVRNSALTIYQSILNKDPKNNKALEGIENIKNTYITWANNEIRQGDYPHAEYLYRKALELAPADPEILSYIEQLQQTTNNYFVP